MREVNLYNAVDAIKSSRQATRKQGLEDLESVLKQSRNSSKALADGDFRHILDTLLQRASEEKQALIKAKTANAATSKTSVSKNAAASRLTACTSAIRLTIEIGVATFEDKTAQTFLRHFIEEIRDDSDCFTDELIDDYTKALLTILSYRPHLEYLKGGHWSVLVDLCCEALRHVHENLGAAQEGFNNLRNRSAARLEQLSRAGTPALSDENSFSIRSQTNDRPAAGHQKRTDDLAACLEKLTCARHLDILTKADQLLDIVGTVLRSTATLSRIGTQEPCLGVLSNLLREAVTEDVPLATKILSESVYFTRRHWGSHKVVQALKDQMLVCLIRGQLLFPSLIEASSPGGDADDLEGLLDRLMTEYRGRLVKDMLSMHDVYLDQPSSDQHSDLLSIAGASVRGNATAESSWCQLSLIADIFSRFRLGPVHTLNGHGDGSKSKRRRVETPLHSFVSVVSTAKHEEIVASLQFLTFILGSTQIQADQLQYIVDKLFPLLSRDDGDESNWSLLALSMVAQQDTAHEACTDETSWQQILQVAITRFSTNRVSRAACNLASVILRKELVSFTDASDSLDSLLTAVDVSGPVFLEEASVGFWKTVLASYNIHRTASSDQVMKAILRWLFLTWKPSRYGLTRARPPSLSCVTELLQILVGESAKREKRGRRTLYLLSRASLDSKKDSGLVKYLLSMDDRETDAGDANSAGQILTQVTRVSGKTKRTTLSTICEYLSTEIDSLLAAFGEASQPHQLSLALIGGSLSVCVVALGLFDSVAIYDTGRANTLLDQATRLRDRTRDAFLATELSSNRLGDMTQTMYGVFEDIQILPLRSFKQLSLVQVGALRVAKSFGKGFWDRALDPQAENLELEDDPMGMDESQESHVSRAVAVQPTEDITHDWLCTYTDQRAYQFCIRADLCLACEISDPLTSSSDEDEVLPSGIVTYLTNLHPLEFLATRPWFDDVYSSRLHIKGQDGARLLEFIGLALSAYNLNRCETAIAMCVDLMAYLVRQWAPAEMEGDLADAAQQLYGLFLTMVRKRAITSHASTAVAKLLQRVIKTNSEYGHNDDLPSARTVLFKILAGGSAKVKFNISKSISAVFGLFILREHDSILDDIEASIPHDPECLPVTAVRLFLLSRLAASWSTLIRRCIYAIVEATGLSPEVSPYAHSCLRFLGKELAIESQHDLFKLFVSQILYTWLGSRPISELPYSIFDYGSLSELVNDCKHEIAAQIIMHGKEAEVADVVRYTGMEFPHLLTEAFGKSAAYCIARDTAVSPDDNPEAAHAAVRLRKYLGKEDYKALIAERFPEIVAIFFRIIDREDQIVKGFQKHGRHAAARDAFESMILSGASQNTPPVSQQPSFSSTCLINELEYICERSPFNADNLWTPALYVYVFRGLLETIQPALGPLHAAAVVRRIRILVSMGGDIGTTGYCLEMALGSLRPYLNNTHSAEDVMGLYRYLLKAGKNHLQEDLPFLTGFVVSVLASLKAFMDRPQESTTQESVFRATLTKAQEFHQWIANYALSLQTPSDDHDVETLKQMIQHASNLQGHGSSDKDTPEGQLLYLLLEDKATGEDLIDESSRQQIVHILAKEFGYTTDRANDILAKEEDVTALASTAWQYFDPGGASRSFNLWLLRGLGRTYASTGFIEASFRREISEQIDTEDIVSTQDHPSLTSSAALVKLLYRVVCNNSTSEAGIAERTLQSLLTRANKQGYLKPLEPAIPEQALAAMTWGDFHPPLLVASNYEAGTLQESISPREQLSINVWAKAVCIALIDEGAKDDAFLADLKAALTSIPGLAQEALPYVLHLVLAREAGNSEQTRKVVSSQLKHMLEQYSTDFEPQIKQMINAIIYLRSQPLPQEKTKIERSKWLEVDYRQLSRVAIECRLYKTALLFIEIALSSEPKTRSSRRSSTIANNDLPTDSLLMIFQNIDEKDYYYGVRQPSSLASMMEKLEFEGASFESLAFRGMAYDAETRKSGRAQLSTNAFIQDLNDLQLSGLSHAMATAAEGSTLIASEPAFDAARKLEKWDIPVPESDSGSAVNLYQAFQDIQTVSGIDQILSTIDLRLEAAFPLIAGAIPDTANSPSFWSSLAALVELESVLTSTSSEQLQQTWLELEHRSKWMESTSFENIDRLLSCRETLFSVLSKNSNLQQLSNSSAKHVRHVQVQSLLFSSGISRVHGNLSKSLSAATAIEQLLPECQEIALNVEAAARLEASNVLWEQGQMGPSIQMLQDISNELNLKQQDLKVGKPDILSKLASRISEARLEQPDRILASYLEPALKEIRNEVGGEAAGQVFHEFASFCDRQLQDPDSLEDFNRARKMRDDKAAEVREFDEMIKRSLPSKERDSLKSHRNKAQTWLALDEAEYRRIKIGRDSLLTQSLDMYLLCLRACDSYDRDAMRFSALWLQNADDKTANDAVKKHIGEVSSSKFASLMNQWTSRLLDEENDFQTLLSNLVVRICGDHPFHAMYNIFVSSKSKGGKDAIALSRHAAANQIVDSLKQQRDYTSKWVTIHNACVNYQRFAVEKKPNGDKWKQGDKGLLRKINSGLKLEQDVVNLRVPPPTMKIELRQDRNYKDVPVIVKWSAEFSVASGLSAPKIVTAFSSDGQKYKMLFKSGNDDLRQDAIMEQVFEQVSDLLRAHRETRQRNLGIRSYKVLPLTYNAGVIEFVSNTIPLLEYLTPAHVEHYPNDLKNNGARKIIQDAANGGQGNDWRIREYKRVCERFHPVLRFFFMERFESPDDWFEKRLAYTRTTAAISMLGHVLGLGDRHGHNILLDEETGEVIHIDLGIAFEQGRVLPIPETVPFRLTRDIVDGMGITKTEGVFRRCCEFTLDALRKESYGILTILDVLRFDPLYSWSISPLRLRRLQADRSQAEEEVTADDGIAGQGRAERKDNEEAEADRALTVVSKKLSKSLSVEATVNQLIQQATDEKNLALLFAGWAAYF